MRKAQLALLPGLSISYVERRSCCLSGGFVSHHCLAVVGFELSSSEPSDRIIDSDILINTMLDWAVGSSLYVVWIARKTVFCISQPNFHYFWESKPTAGILMCFSDDSRILSL